MSDVLAGLWIVCLMASSCQPLDLIDAALPGDGEESQSTPAAVQPTVRDLAADLDSLERQIERYGSVVAQQPSVWGQARLTMYREEFEKEMAAQLNNFHATLQGSLSRSDQAYAADALALSYTAQAAAAGNPSGGGKKGASSSSSSSNTSTAGAGGGGGGGGAAPSPPASTSSQGGDAAPVPGAFDAFNSIQRDPARLASPLGFAGSAGTGTGGIALEPTTYLDQMKRYIDHLHDLRRMSDGDDTADAPGYSLNLVRIPVSVLPGRKTEQRYGAEITFTLRPHLHDELLPMTFRNLVVNDLIDQVGVPLTQTLNDQQWQRAMVEVWGSIEELNKWSGGGTDQDVRRQFIDRIAEAMDVNYACKTLGDTASPADSARGLSSARMTKALAHYKEIQHRAQYLAVQSSTRLRTANRPFPPSQIVDIYGTHGWAEIVCTAWQLFCADVPNKDIVHYPDVQNYLQEELGAAYAFLKAPDARPFWELCSPELANDVHSRRLGSLYTRRCEFEKSALAVANATSKASANPGMTTALAWAILVDSSLLNQQLIEDMKQAPVARGGAYAPPNCPAGQWPAYFLPDPGKPERDAFNEYVRCRWPLHVFALDPEADQQNIADSYSSRREMQLAMSLAFVSGNLSANNMFRFARRLETDMETIALNNTIVGFSHGTETFGWRFYPRYQTPDTPGNLTACFQEFFCGGPNRKALLRQRQLEPGIRECVAIVLMPSFVPYADLDASSNWFALDNPRRKLMNSQAAIRLGEQLKFIENCSRMGAVNVQCSRDGDLERLMRRADQLEARLPLQSMSVQVPYENTLGGFAMFSTGVTDLAPELFGWYGAPAINLDGSTTIFLIGNHFSVHQTRVLVGGQEITQPEMLSRQVMKVTIPANAIALIEKTGTIAGGWKAPTGATSLPSAQTKSPAALEDREASSAGQPTTSPSAATASPVPVPTADASPNRAEPVSHSEIVPAALPDQSTQGSQPAAAPSLPDSVPAQVVSTEPQTSSSATGPAPPTAAKATPAIPSPTAPASPTSSGATQPASAGPTTISAPSGAMLNLSQAQFLSFSSSADHENEIVLGDPQRDARDEQLTLSVNHGSLSLGMTGGLTFTAGANGTTTLTVQGKLPDLNQALEGLTYIPTPGFAGSDALSISFTGKGTPSPCRGSVGITVNQFRPDYYFVDVQLATPYGTTSHLLVPAWHLGKAGSGSLPTAGTDPTAPPPSAAQGANGSGSGAQPQWNTATLSANYVAKGSSLALSSPPDYVPTALTLNLGPNYQLPSDGNVSLKMTVRAKTSSMVPTVTIAAKPTTSGTAGGNYDAKTHMLTISGADLNNLATNLFTVISTQFGASNPISPTNNSVTFDTTVSGTGQSDVKVANALTVTLLAAPPQPGLASTTPSKTSGGSTTVTR
ncbi:MAG TPA: hypothetical protein VGP76_02035 [Planctomycetaceae bacterium]|nr:hypothetical protein [Planctomycetaceae bacterium]